MEKIVAKGFQTGENAPHKAKNIAKMPPHGEKVQKVSHVARIFFDFPGGGGGGASAYSCILLICRTYF